MTSISLHIPRNRKPIFTVGHVRLLLVVADIALWVGIVWAVRHALS